MNKNEVMEIGAIVIGGLALFLFLRHGTESQAGILPPSDETAAVPSTYLTVNQPLPGAGARTSLNNVVPSNLAPAAQIQQPCGCGGTPVSYSGSNAFTDFLNAQDESAVSSYYNSVMHALPNWISEFVNNTLAPDETMASQGAFANLAGGQ